MSLLQALVLTSGVLVAMTTADSDNLIRKTDPLPNTPATRPRTSASAVVDAVIDLIGQSCIFAEDNLFLRRLAFLETRDGVDASTYRSNYHGGIWKVDQNMFHATQANTPALQQKYAAIRNAFGIDWMSVQWQKLEIPLYSGLAAALYISTKGSVPSSLEQQGTYVEQKYNARDTAFEYMRAISQVPICDSETLRNPADIAFMLDATTSNTDFNRMRNFMQEVVNGLSSKDRVAVYQFGGDVLGRPDVQKNIALNTYTDHQLLTSAVGHVLQSNTPHTAPDTGRAAITVIHDAFSQSSGTRPLSSKILIVLTDKASSDSNQMTSAGQDARNNGVAVLTLGIGGSINTNEYNSLVTQPTCRHFVAVNNFQDLTYFVQLTQRFICNELVLCNNTDSTLTEPMIARGMVHCNFSECRNIAIPITYPDTTVITNVTCSNGRVYLASRMVRPGRGFDEDNENVYSNQGPTLITVKEDVGSYIYADFFPANGAHPTCKATISTVHGVPVQPSTTPVSTCQAWQYPAVNPCQVQGRTQKRFAYSFDQSKFIQCDEQNRMYLTECPPGYPYFDPNCEICVGGPNDPLCPASTQTVSHAFCGIGSNPCTRDTILRDHLFFACPDSEKNYLQCNIWGEAYIQSCPQNQVWRESAMTCEYEPLQRDPCSGGLRFYPYTPDPHIYIDCGTDQVATLRHCNVNLEWNVLLNECDFPPTATPAYQLTYPILTQPIYYFYTTARPSVTNPPQIHTPGNGPISTNFAYPCTQDHINAMKLYWPDPQNRHFYIQCDLWGDAYIKSCQAGFFWDEFAVSCVNGPVEVDNVVGR